MKGSDVAAPCVSVTPTVPKVRLLNVKVAVAAVVEVALKSMAVTTAGSKVNVAVFWVSNPVPLMVTVSELP